MKTAPYLILLSLFTTTLFSAELRVGEGQAYATITEALNAANSGDTIIIHEGIYRETCVVQDDNLTIVAAEGEHVVISGMDPVSNWQPDGANVFYSDITLDPGLEFPMVFVDNHRYKPAAYPDYANDVTRYDHWGQNGITLTATSATNYETTVDFDTGKPDNHWAGGILLSITGKSWQVNDNEILSSTATTLEGDRLQDREFSGHGGVPSNSGPGRGIIIFHRNALDNEGEFHYDRNTSRVYVWYSGPESVPQNVEVRTRELGMDFNGHADIKVRGITFYGAEVDMSYTDNCELTDCAILYGTSFYTNARNEQFNYSLNLREAKDALVSNNYIAFGWAPAIGMRADEWGRGMDVIISENVIENTGWLAPTQGAIYLYGAKKNLILSHNSIRNLASEAITGYARGMEISHNYISTVMTMSVDGGAIYLYGQGEDASRSYNWIEHCYDYIEAFQQDGHDNVRGIYTDGGADYHHIHNNVIWRCTDGTNHNNEFVDGDLIDIRLRNNTFWDIDDRMISGWWAPGGDGVVTDMTTHNNLGNGVSSKFEDTTVPFLGSTTPVNQVFNNYSTIEEGTSAADLFVDATPDEFSDFRLKAGSPAIDYGVVYEGFPNAFDWDGDAPDAGAYEYGDSWTAGAPDFSLAEDTFESGSAQGGTGWAGSWMVTGNVSFPTGGKDVFHQDRGLLLQGGASGPVAEREVELRTAKVGALSFYWRSFGRQEGEDIVVSVLDGDREVMLRVIEASEDSDTDGESWSEWRLETLNLTGFGFENATQILRIDASMLASPQAVFYMDSLRIDDYFNKKIPPLSVIQLGASGILDTSATLNGDLLSTGGFPTQVYIAWGTSDEGMNLDAWQHVIDLGYKEEGSFSASISSLLYGKEYFFRILAVNDAGDEMWSEGFGRFQTKSLSIPQVGLELWLDGDDIDGDGNPEGSGESGLNGSTLLFWRDKSGNGAAAVPTSSGSPGLDVDGINGRNSVRFTGGNKSMAIDRGFPLHTIFAVVQGDDTGEFASYYRIFASPLEASGGTKAANPLMTSPVAYYNNLKFSPIDADTSVNGRNLATNLENGGLERLFDLGLQPNDAVILRTSSTSGPTPVVSDWHLGSDSNTWNGLMGEIIVYSRALTELEINQVGHYLADKWGFEPVSKIVPDDQMPPHEVDFINPAIAEYLFDSAYNFRSNFASRALLDSDGDEQTNLQEFFTGTDMDDPNSFTLIRLLEVLYNPVADAIEISLTGAPAATYRLIELDSVTFSQRTGSAMPLIGAGRGTYNENDETVTSTESGDASFLFDLGESSRIFLWVELVTD
jgi:hypothetical protein